MPKRAKRDTWWCFKESEQDSHFPQVSHWTLLSCFFTCCLNALCFSIGYFLSHTEHCSSKESFPASPLGSWFPRLCFAAAAGLSSFVNSVDLSWSSNFILLSCIESELPLGRTQQSANVSSCLESSSFLWVWGKTLAERLWAGVRVVLWPSVDAFWGSPGCLKFPFEVELLKPASPELWISSWMLLAFASELSALCLFLPVTPSVSEL